MDKICIKLQRLNDENNSINLVGCISITNKNNIIFSCTSIENGFKNIPPGTYNINFTRSNKFNSNTWHITNVKGRTGIRIHRANFGHELSGCIALGSFYARDMLWFSKPTMREFHKVLEPYQGKTLTIKILNNGSKTMGKN